MAMPSDSMAMPSDPMAMPRDPMAMPGTLAETEAKTDESTEKPEVHISLNLIQSSDHKLTFQTSQVQSNAVAMMRASQSPENTSRMNRVVQRLGLHSAGLRFGRSASQLVSRNDFWKFKDS